MATTTSRMALVPVIPEVPAGIDAALTAFLKSIKVTIDTREGRTAAMTDKFVTFGALIAMGIDISSRYQVQSTPPNPRITGDAMPPGMPTLFTVTPVGVNSHRLQWTNPTDADLWAVEVWVSNTNDITTSTLLAVVTIPDAQRGLQSFYIASGINSNFDYHYWLRSKDWSGNLSNFAAVGTVVANANPTLAELVAELWGTLDYAQLSNDLQNSIDLAAGLDGKLVLAANANGHVSGVVLTNDGTESEMVIVVDKFKIVNNTDPLNVSVPFVVGEIDGFPAVGVSGALIVDGTIRARAIETNSLTSDQINTSVINVTDFAGTGTLATQDSVAYADVTDKPLNLYQIYYQLAVPSVGVQLGDFWIHSSSKELQRWSGAAWVSVQDTDIAQALTDASDAWDLADEKAHIYFQTTAPTGLTSADAGDLWFDTDDANATYKWSGSAWVLAPQDYSKLADALGIKPDDNATVGAIWGTDLSGIPARFGEAPAGDGLYVTSTYMGFYKTSAWANYFDNTGKFYFKGDANNFISWNGTTFVISTNKSVDIKAGGDITMNGSSTNPAIIKFYGYTGTYVGFIGSATADSARITLSPASTLKRLDFGSVGYTPWNYIQMFGLTLDLYASDVCYVGAGSSRLTFTDTGDLIEPGSTNVITLGTSSKAFKAFHSVQAGLNAAVETGKTLNVHGPGTTSSTYSIYAADNNNAGYFYCRDDKVVWCNAGAWYTSDAKSKENIEDLSGVVGAKMLAITPKGFNLIGDSKETVGFIAQDLAPLIPEAVKAFHHPKPDGQIDTEETLAITDGPIIAYLVKWGQEQQAYIDALSARVEALETGLMKAA